MSDALDLSWVEPHLAIGGRLTDIGELVREGVRGVVDLRAEERDDARALCRAGVALLSLPTVDLRAPSDAALVEGVRWVLTRMDGGEKVLVHCEHGIGRSAVLACCVLVSGGRTPLEALALAKRARPAVSPSPEQLEALRRWAGRTRGEVPTFDECARIAYS